MVFRFGVSWHGGSDRRGGPSGIGACDHSVSRQPRDRQPADYRQPGRDQQFLRHHRSPPGVAKKFTEGICSSKCPGFPAFVLCPSGSRVMISDPLYWVKRNSTELPLVAAHIDQTAVALLAAGPDHRRKRTESAAYVRWQ